MNKKRILIVDDEKDIADTIQFMLEFEDFECLVAYDGEEALSKAKEGITTLDEVMRVTEEE